MKRLLNSVSLNSFLPDFEVFSIHLSIFQCHRFGNANYLGPLLQIIALQCSVSQQIGTLIQSNSGEDKCKSLRQESMDFRPCASNKRTHTSCKLPEFINEKELCTGPFRSDFMTLQQCMKP